MRANLNEEFGAVGRQSWSIVAPACSVIEAICDDNAIPLDVGAPPAPYPSGKNINYAPKSTRLLPKSRLFFSALGVCRETLGACMQRATLCWCIFQQSRSVISAPLHYLFTWLVNFACPEVFNLPRAPVCAAGCFCNFTSCNATAQLCHFICRHFEVEVAPECVTAPRSRESMQIAFLLDAPMRRPSQMHTSANKALSLQRLNLSRKELVAFKSYGSLTAKSQLSGDKILMRDHRYSSVNKICTYH
jgi:hypothetical protein